MRSYYRASKRWKGWPSDTARNKIAFRDVARDGKTMTDLFCPNCGTRKVSEVEGIHERINRLEEDIKELQDHDIIGRYNKEQAMIKSVQRPWNSIEISGMKMTPYKSGDED